MARHIYIKLKRIGYGLSFFSGWRITLLKINKNNQGMIIWHSKK